MSTREVSAEEQNGQEVDSSAMHRAIAGAATGNALEWFDFGVYGYFAVTIGQVFFPSQGSTMTALLESFAVFAVAFVARPFGSLVFGPMADRIGRSRVLVITILMMSGATFAVGLLPTYSTIGIWAPIGLIVLRLIQGFSTGGEYGSAATFIVEYSPDERRGFLSSWLEFGTMVGYSLAAILAILANIFLSTEAMQAWGWRIPFLAAAPLGLFGLYLRLKLEDSPAFKQTQESGEASQTPFREVVKYHWRSMLLCVGLTLILNVAYYTVLKYLPSYLTTRLGINEVQSLLLSLGILIGIMILVTFIGRTSDRIGRKPVVYAACIGMLVCAYPAFALMTLDNVWLTFLGLSVIGFFVALLAGVMPSTLPAIFRTYVRGSGFTISYNLSTSVFGGTAPFLVTWLISVTGNDYMPAFYLMGAAAIALIPALLIGETAGRPLQGSRSLRGARTRPAH